MGIVINADDRPKQPVSLVGVDYLVKPPKMAVLATVAKAASKGTGDAAQMVGHVENLVKLMFGNDSKKVLARLENPEDDLDYTHIMMCAEQLIEETSEDPTS